MLNSNFDASSAEFCDFVKEEAKKRNLKVFAVVFNELTQDGASFTSDIEGDVSPIPKCRASLVEWEIQHGLNPHHTR
jgi:hypothetical protein